MIYLDNNATTKPNSNMLNAANDVVSQYYGNPSSLHLAGFDARNILDFSRERIAQALNCKDHEIVFTSGGTEANSLVLANELRYSEVITSDVEHASVSKASSDYEIGVDKHGNLDFESFEFYLKQYGNKEMLVSVMMSNNETGVVSDPNNELFKLKEKYNFTLHMDAVQAFGKLNIDLQEMPIDMLSISAHKIHGLKGCGALYISDRLSVELQPKPLFVGGSHERNYRPGTENQIGIFSLGYMADMLTTNQFYKDRVKQITQKRNIFEKNLASIAEVNGDKNNRVGNTSNLYFEGITDLDLFLEMLSEGGVCASGKSACSSGMPAPSKVLKAMFGDSKRLHGSVRFSLSVDTTDKEIEQAVCIIGDTFKECLKMQEIKR